MPLSDYLTRSEVDLFERGRVVLLGITHCITGNQVENAQNVIATVTLLQHRDHHLLRHNVFVRC